MRETHLNRWSKLGTALAVSSALGLVSGAAMANQKLVELQQQNENWVMQGKDFSGTHYSTQTQINKKNVNRLRPSWSFSTGVLNGHEGSPLVVNGTMYIHTPFPNNTFAVDLDEPGVIKWEHKPKQDPAARAVACCDVVNLVWLIGLVTTKLQP